MELFRYAKSKLNPISMCAGIAEVYATVSDSEEFNPETEGVMDDATYTNDVDERREGSFVLLAKFWNAAEAHVLRFPTRIGGHSSVCDR